MTELRRGLRRGLRRPARDHSLSGGQILQAALRRVEGRPSGDHCAVRTGEPDGRGRLLAGGPGHAQLGRVFVDVLPSVFIREDHGQHAGESW